MFCAGAGAAEERCADSEEREGLKDYGIGVCDKGGEEAGGGSGSGRGEGSQRSDDGESESDEDGEDGEEPWTDASGGRPHQIDARTVYEVHSYDLRGTYHPSSRHPS